MWSFLCIQFGIHSDQRCHDTSCPWVFSFYASMHYVARHNRSTSWNQRSFYFYLFFYSLVISVCFLICSFVLWPSSCAIIAPPVEGQIRSFLCFNDIEIKVFAFVFQTTAWLLFLSLHRAQSDNWSPVDS